MHKISFFNNSEIAAKLCGRRSGDCVNYAGTKIFSRYVLVFFIGKFGSLMRPNLLELFGKSGLLRQLGLLKEIKKAKMFNSMSYEARNLL